AGGESLEVGTLYWRRGFVISRYNGRAFECCRRVPLLRSGKGGRVVFVHCVCCSWAKRSIAPFGSILTRSGDDCGAASGAVVYTRAFPCFWWGWTSTFEGFSAMLYRR
ncbi:unnamed protein product, partial [Hapterophycus canaliculatus]